MDSSPFFVASSDLTKPQKHEFVLDFSMFDALDACLMVHGSWLKAHGSWLMAKGGQGRLLAHGQMPPRPWGPRAGAASGHEP